MKLPTKTTQRVILLLVVVLVLAGGLAGAYALRKWQHNREALARRALGVEAFEAGRYADAMGDLAAYLQRYNEDVEALDLLAKARLKVVEPDNRQIPQAMRVLRRILDLDPDNQTARQKLLELYTRAGLNTEASALADTVLTDHPQDLSALRAKAIALARLRKFDAALPIAEQYVALDPSDLEMQTTLLDVEFQVRHNADALIARAAKLRQKEPANPRWKLLEAYAYRHAGDRQNMVKWLKAAADHAPPDDRFTLLLVGLFDEAQQYGDALGVLEKAVTDSHDVGLNKELALRLWEQNRWQDVIGRLKGLDPRTGDIDLLALQAMSFYQTQHPDAGRKVVDLLAARGKRSPRAAAWASVLDALHGGPPESAARIVDVCRQALAQAPNNAFFEYVLGNAYAQMGEREVAVVHWRRAAARRRAWVMPQVHLARAYLASGRPADALRAASAAIVRAPNSREAVVVWALARAANLAGSRTDSAAKLLKVVDAVVKSVPDEQRLIPLRISLLANTGKRDEAIKAFKAALARKKPLRQATLLQLKQTSRVLNLGLDEAVAARIEAVYGTTPELVLASAVSLAREGKSEAGLRLLETRGRSSGKRGAIPWRMARARYLDAIGDPRSRAEWTALADELPRNDQVQRLALQSRAIQADRQTADRLIDRLRSLSGDQGITWRLERAKWLLRHGSAARDVSKATALLQEVVAESPNLPAAHLLLARSFERLGAIERATEELETAARLRPGATAIVLDLARLEQRQEDFDAARKQLQRVLANPSASPAARSRAALMLADQGGDQQAIKVLESLQAQARTANPDRDVALAKLYWQTRATDKLKAQCRKLMAAPTANGIRFLALYYSAVGRRKEAEQALARLDQLDLPPGTRDSIRADYDAQFGTPDEAIQQYRAAVKAAPKDPVMWYRLIIAQVLLGRGEAAVKAAGQGLEMLPDNPNLKYFHQHAELVRQMAGNTRLRPLLTALVRNDSDRSTAVAVLKILAAAQRANQPVGEVASAVQRLAKDHRDFLPLQDLLVSLQLQAGRIDAAARTALAAMRAFPDAIEPAWLAAETLARANRWPEALEAANQWRRRAAGQPLKADLMIAEARTRLGNSRAARAQLKPYLQQALAHPEQYPEVLVQHARTLIADGQVDQAAAVLGPLLGKSPRWRQAWMRLAILAVKDAKTSAQWLKTVAEKIPADAAPEYLLLGQYWLALGLRFDQPEFQQNAQRAFDRATKNPATAADAWVTKALVAEKAKDLSSAEKCYRAALKHDPKRDAALNNLAMILINSGGDHLDEALALARRALALVPDRTNYLDTLAQVQTRRHQYEPAIASLRKATQLEPNEKKWKIHLERTLRLAGHRQEADRLQRKIQQRWGANTPPTGVR